MKHLPPSCRCWGAASDSWEVISVCVSSSKHSAGSLVSCMETDVVLVCKIWVMGISPLYQSYPKLKI